MAHEYEVYQCPKGHPKAGQWTFRVDGRESLYYCPETLGNGRSGRHAAERVVARLKAGRSRELDAVRAGTRKLSVKAVAGEALTTTAGVAKATPEDVAVAAFMTRGKLGRLKEAEQTLASQLGLPVVVEVTPTGSVVARGGDRTFLVGLDAKGETPPRFKPVN